MSAKLIADFKNSRMNCDSEPRNGHPNEVTTAENVENIHKMNVKDCRLKVFETVKAIGMSLSECTVSYTII